LFHGTDAIEINGASSVKKILFGVGTISLLFGWIHASTLIAIALLAIFVFGKVEFSS
jgi:hypothetical protein